MLVCRPRQHWRRRRFQKSYVSVLQHATIVKYQCLRPGLEEGDANGLCIWVRCQTKDQPGIVNKTTLIVQPSILRTTKEDRVKSTCHGTGRKNQTRDPTHAETPLPVLFPPMNRFQSSRIFIKHYQPSWHILENGHSASPISAKSAGDGAVQASATELCNQVASWSERVERQDGSSWWLSQCRCCTG